MKKKIIDIVQKKIQEKDFIKYDFKGTTTNEVLATYVKENSYYIIELDKDRKKITLSVGSVENNKFNEDTNTISTWLFSVESDNEKQATSIANDIVETLCGPENRKVPYRQKLSSKKNDEDSNSPIFFINRLATIFPDIKEDIQAEKTDYESFRYVNFVREKIVPKIKETLQTNNKASLKKLGKILNDNYENGDLDTRGLITIVILNAIEDEKEKLLPLLDASLTKACIAAEKLKGKKIKPERAKKKNIFAAMMQGEKS